MIFSFVSDGGDLSQKVREIFLSISSLIEAFLISLVPAVNKKHPGIESISKAGWDVIHSNEKIYSKSLSMVDSGGYSIIVGVRPPEEMNLVIECYLHAVSRLYMDVDCIFSLDIPHCLKYKEFNTVKNIYEANTESLTHTIELCKQTPELSKKLFFVNHFKMRPQYYIWKKLRKDLQIQKYMHNWAIGGMVGLRKATNIKFSAFTGMSYCCLREFLKKNHTDRRFRMHVLGVYLPCDRFQIALLEKLFSLYLKDNERPPMFSYDSINPKIAAVRNAKEPFFDLSEDGLYEVYRTLTEVPDSYPKKIYTPKGLEQYRVELGRRIRDEKLEQCAIFAPLYVQSFITTDKLIEILIDAYDLVNLIYNTKSITTVKAKIEVVLKDLKDRYPYIFKTQRCEIIRQNIVNTHRWHRAYIDHYSSEKYFDERMEEDIARINFDEILTLS